MKRKKFSTDYIKAIMLRNGMARIDDLKYLASSISIFHFERRVLRYFTSTGLLKRKWSKEMLPDNERVTYVKISGRESLGYIYEDWAKATGESYGEAEAYLKLTLLRSIKRQLLKAAAEILFVLTDIKILTRDKKDILEDRVAAAYTISEIQKHLGIKGEYYRAMFALFTDKRSYAVYSLYGRPDKSSYEEVFKRHVEEINTQRGNDGNADMIVIANTPDMYMLLCLSPVRGRENKWKGENAKKLKAFDKEIYSNIYYVPYRKKRILQMKLLLIDDRVKILFQHILGSGYDDCKDNACFDAFADGMHYFYGYDLNIGRALVLRKIDEFEKDNTTNGDVLTAPTRFRILCFDYQKEFYLNLGFSENSISVIRPDEEILKLYGIDDEPKDLSENMSSTDEPEAYDDLDNDME